MSAVLSSGKYTLIVVRKLLLHPKAVFYADGGTFFLDSTLTIDELERFQSPFERRTYEIVTLYVLTKQQAVEAVKQGYLVYSTKKGLLSTFPGQGAMLFVSSIPVIDYVSAIRSGVNYAVMYEEKLAILRDADLKSVLIQLIEQEVSFLAKPL